MRNPYAYSGGAEGAPGAELSQDPRRADYQAALGPNGDYYRNRFERFEAGGPPIGWHWPAFFVTSAWFVYRRMWFIGVLNFVYPFVVWAWGLLAVGLTRQPAAGYLALFLLPLPWILLPLFANRIYWRRIDTLIQDMPARVAHDPQLRAGYLRGKANVASRQAVAVATVVVVVWGAMIGAAISGAIPAYRTYAASVKSYEQAAARQQIEESLKHLTRLKLGVADYFAHHHAWPADLDALGQTALTTGLDMASVTLHDGSIILQFGDGASKPLQGKFLALRPGANEYGDVIWGCAERLPAGVTRMSTGPSGTSVHADLLPVACRNIEP